jgi:hypothetical protein
MSLLNDQDKESINKTIEDAENIFVENNNMKDLKDKAIDIKGKKYVLVSDRVLFFNEKYDAGMIQTKLVSQPDADLVVFMAKVTPDISSPERYFTGYSQAKWGDGLVNTTAALENAETSSVGRALALMGIGVIDSIASVDEMSKAGVTSKNDVLKNYNDKLGNCPKCDAPMVISKNTGNPYCSAFCWKGEEANA